MLPPITPARTAEIDGIMATCFSHKVRQGMSNRFYLKYRTQAIEFEECYQRAVVKLLEHLHRYPEKSFDNTAHVASYLWMTLNNEVIKFKGNRIHENTRPFTDYVVSSTNEEEFSPVDKLLVAPPADVFAEELPYDTRLAELARVYYAQLTPEQQLILATYLRLGNKEEVADELGLSLNKVSRVMSALQEKCRKAAAKNSRHLEEKPKYVKPVKQVVPAGWANYSHAQLRQLFTTLDVTTANLSDKQREAWNLYITGLPSALAAPQLGLRVMAYNHRIAQAKSKVLATLA